MIDPTAKDRHPAIPVPKGGFASHEEEAHWLADTIAMRMQEAAANIGASIKVPNDSLYDLLLLGLQSAAKREGKKLRAEHGWQQIETAPKHVMVWGRHGARVFLTRYFTAQECCDLDGGTGEPEDYQEGWYTGEYDESLSAWDNQVNPSEWAPFVAPPSAPEAADGK